MYFRSIVKNLAVPFVFALMFSSYSNSKAATVIKPLTVITQDSIFARVDVQPQFPGGLDGFGAFLGNNIKYPADDAKNKVQGRVICKFVVERDGRLTNIEVLRTPTEAMGKEAQRVLSLSPKWTPGRQKGKLVRVAYTVPISFSLNR
jgi:protein TonB